MPQIRKLVFFMVCVLLCLCTGCADEKSGKEQQAYSIYGNYREIPGITAEEIAAIEALKTKYGHFTIGMNPATEAFVSGDGSIGGYSRYFREWMSGLFGIPFETEIYEWDALIEGLNDYSIDFNCDLTASEERRRIYFMTDAVAERSIKYFVLAGSERLNDIAKERTLRYAFLEGTTTYTDVRDAALEDFTPFFVGDYTEATKLLDNGEIDAFLDESSAESVFDDHGGIVSRDFLPLIYSPVSLSTANPEFAPIISVVQKYLDQGAIYQLIELYN